MRRQKMPTPSLFTFRTEIRALLLILFLAHAMPTRLHLSGLVLTSADDVNVRFGRAVGDDDGGGGNGQNDLTTASNDAKDAAAVDDGAARITTIRLAETSKEVLKHAE